VVVESEPCSGISESLLEVEDRGLRFGLQVRAGGHLHAEEEAAGLGLTTRVPMPGMAVTPKELAVTRAPGLEIARVDDEEGLAEAALVAASTGAKLELTKALFAPGNDELLGAKPDSMTGLRVWRPGHFCNLHRSRSATYFFRPVMP
jgi:hypothetical protein